MSRGFVQHVTLTGKVLSLSEDAGQACFTLETRSEDRFVVYVTGNTWWRSLKNLDEIDRDRYGEDDASRGGEPEKKIRKYLNVGRLVLLEGVLFQNELKRRIDARTVYLLYSQDDKPVSQYEGKFLFEGGHWWLNQIRALADQWLESLFPEKDTYDFHGYRSNLDFEFHPTKDNTQECATMSRLIYGLSSAFLLTGTTRYLDAARAGVEYQRKHFKTLSHDGESVIWAFAKKGAEIIIPSQNGEDFGSVPLYEQIYCLAGLTQYYRATLDRAVLEDIRLTVNSFQKFFRDTSALKGYFSHLDYATMKTTSPSLGDNSNRKNWNSVGDHIPAYLINLLLALEPLEGDPSLSSFIRQARELLKETTTLIVEKFPQKGNPYVMERFHADWTPDTTHGWQQNRAVVGHNLKIAWNLTRVAFYYASKENPDVNPDKLLEVANFLAEGMVKTGAVDVFRGGIYDCVERNPQNGQSVEFAWMNTKDFWQQEQAILAYYILYGYTKNNTYLELAREMSVFWNAFFLDHDNKGVYFRTTDDGVPIVKDSYGIKAGHAIAGYHMFELNYLAHVYVMSYAAKKPYTLYFQPAADTDATALGVLPDFVDHKTTHISSVTVNGQTTKFDKITCSVPLKSEHRGKSIKVEISVDGEPAHPAPAPKPKLLHKIGVLVESHFDETEVREFEKVFPQHGYELVYISNLWNQDFLDFTGNDHNDPLRVRVDVSKVNIPDYKGFLFIGGYAMDRLRYESLPKQGEENQSPLAKFVRKLADHPEVKIGTICHSLWAFTVVPELLKGKKVTCANNVIYDVLNAGGEVQYEKEGATKVVVVDGNLITGNHPANTKQFAAKFLEELQSSTIA